MKKIIILSFIIASFFNSCKTEEVPIFNEENRVYFENFYMDAFAPGKEEASVNSNSFFFYPTGTKTMTIPVTVILSGKKLESDKTFRVKVVNKEDVDLELDEEYTTANPSEYTLEPSYTFHANTITEESIDIRDVFNVTINYSDRLDSNPDGYKLVIELVPTEGMGVGQYERRRAVIVFSKNPSKPKWWDDEVTDNLLGEFSVKKFKLFLTHADVNSFVNKKSIEETPGKVKEIVFTFKSWLANQASPILEEDGTEMTLNV